MDEASAFQPRDAAEIVDFLAGRHMSAPPVWVRSGGSKDGLGRPPPSDAMILDVSAIAGITLYEPEELVLTARAGTRLSDITEAVAARGQCLAFEPPDLATLFGAQGPAALAGLAAFGEPTLGGMVAAGWSGPRRLKAGAVRDHVLGAQAVGGDGRLFKSGGRVVKNVTGFDLPKLLTGSHGTLAVMTEITIKTVPAPERSRTLLLLGSSEDVGVKALTLALGGPYEISGAAHLPEAAAARSSVPEVAACGQAVTVLRLEGFGPSVADRLAALETRFAGPWPSVALEREACRALWREIGAVAPLIDHNRIVWRLSVPPAEGPRVVGVIRKALPATQALYDWGGGLVWLVLPPAVDAHAALVRETLPSGHATLVRAPAETRARVPVFQPQSAALSELGRNVKAAFDPAGMLGRGRMYADL